MMYIPFRKQICNILKKLLLIIEENEVKYYPAISSIKGGRLEVNIKGKGTGLVKKSISVSIITSEVEERIKHRDIF